MNSQPPPVPPDDSSNTPPPVAGPPPVPLPPEPEPPPVPPTPPVPPVPPAPPPPPEGTPVYTYPPAASVGSGPPNSMRVALIGCGALVLAAVGGLIWLTNWSYRKMKELKDNPEQLAAFVLKQHPDVELVKTDKEARTVTIRNKTTGEVITMSHDDLLQGRVTVSRPDGSKAELSQEGLKVTEADGSVTTTSGAGAAPPPAWVPVYPRKRAENIATKTEKNGEITGTLIFQTDDSFEKAMETWKSLLEETFTDVSSSRSDIQGINYSEFSGKQDAPDGKIRRIQSTVTHSEGRTVISIEYSEKAE